MKIIKFVISFFFFLAEIGSRIYFWFVDLIFDIRLFFIDDPEVLEKMTQDLMKRKEQLEEELRGK